MNRTVTTVLRSLCSDPEHKDWSYRVDLAAHHINRAPAKSTGKAPFEVLHGYLPRKDGFSHFIDEQQPEEQWTPPRVLHDEVVMAIEQAQKEYAHHFDKKRREHGVRYSVGEVVVVQRPPKATGLPTKLQKEFRGPMVVTAVLGNDSYQISRLGNKPGSRSYVTTAHCSQLKSFKIAREEGDSIVSDEPDQLPIDAAVEGAVQSQSFRDSTKGGGDLHRQQHRFKSPH